MIPNLAFVVTEGCDLPAVFFDNHPIFVIPVMLKQSQGTTSVDRNFNALRDYYANDKHHFTADIVGVSKQAVKTLLLDTLIYQFDHVIFIAPANAFSQSLQHIRETLLESHNDIEPRRKAASINRPFRSRVIESTQMIAGYGAVLHQGLLLSKQSKGNIDALKAAIENYDSRIDQYAMVGEQTLRSLKGAFDVSWLAQKKMQLTQTVPVFRYHQKRIQHWQSVPKPEKYRAFFELIADNIAASKQKPNLVNVSYSGSLAKIRTLPGYFAFHEYMQQLDITVLHAMMSRSAASMMGLNAIAVACKN